MFDDIEEYQDPVFEFKYTSCDGVESTMKFSADTWVEALERFVAFLRGAGFFLDTDSVAINGNKHQCIDTNLHCSIQQIIRSKTHVVSTSHDLNLMHLMQVPIMAVTTDKGE